MYRETKSGLLVPEDTMTCDICGIVIPDHEEVMGAYLDDGTVFAVCPKHEGKEEFKRFCREKGITDAIEPWTEVKQLLDEERSS